MFLSVIIVIGAVYLLHFVNRRPVSSAATAPVLLVPFFENDERGQYRTAFASQLEQALVRSGIPTGSVYQLPAFLKDRDSAVSNAKYFGATAAVYDANVIREKDSTKACFHIAYVAEGSQPYAMVPLELPAHTANAIGLTLVGATKTPGEIKKSPILARLDTLEGQIASLRATIDQATALQRTGSTPVKYNNKVALVIGVNTLRGAGFSLQYAVSDAIAFAEALRQIGFRTTLLVDAQRDQVMASLTELRKNLTSDDLAILYYAGPSLVHKVHGGKDEVVLPFADSDLSDMTSILSIKQLAEELKSFQARHRLAVLDGCHGTTGLDADSASAGLSAAVTPNEAVVQVLSGSGDDEYGYESAELGGGAFTQTMLQVLGEARRDGSVLWMHELVARTTKLLRTRSSAKQTPKVVTLSGNGEISFASP
ncbi:MAG: caspase family protein [Chlorobium sp.]|nr:caspase family protein [Chlorobium sp.]